MTETEENLIERNLGPQPLDSLMTEAGLDNHALVSASSEPMTHKAVQRARKGRRLTTHMQRRMATALNKALTIHGTPPEREWTMKDLFTY
ncbi:hypothetical protein EI77_01649 [Prosthecobacter fusiformis]|uniref:Uncharacterized protein n=1 Tax=Prosthecobacter fusiformis TaxID=48464 RepID=A0A4R7S4A8_9BACT|nr:hypothetical protein [Prosthecobacter fusiformis]TDU73181.1 hypothetical protein EI77_01649 [Prosthecobacter fusiformis]